MKDKNEKCLVDNESDIEIDVITLLKYVKRKWYIIVITMILCGSIGLVVGLIRPKVATYQASSEVYLRTSYKAVSIHNFEITNYSPKDYLIIFMSDSNLSKIIRNLNLNYSEGELREMISIENPDNTRMLIITVTSKKANDANLIANAVAKYGIKSVETIDSQKPYVVQYASNNKKVEPESYVKKFAFLGLASGMFIGLCIVIINALKH